MANVGVITEQGFPAGQFGFQPISEAEQEKLKEQTSEKKDSAK